MTFALIAAGTVLGLAGTDLVLPAIPSLPGAMEGTLQQAQLVLATFAAGTALGLLIFGELGARLNQRSLLVWSLLGYGVLSAIATLSSSITELVLIRFFQGLTAAAPAVFAPVMIRAMYDEHKTVKMLGVMGSIEATAPALAPVLGAWLLVYFDWRASFLVTSGVALFLSCAWFAGPTVSSAIGFKRSRSGYASLLKNGNFLRYALSQAFTLGGLLIFVFGAPTVITVVMGGELVDFVIMQVVGIAFFMISANLAHRLVIRFGAERTIFAGSLISATGCLAILAYGLGGGNAPEMLWILFIFVNLGLGVRGPPGFHQAIVAAGDNDARGSALVILFVLLAAAIGTSVTAPFIEVGLVPLSAAATCVTFGSVLIFGSPRPPSICEIKT